MRTIFITGATGVMGMATLAEFERNMDGYRLRLLVRPGKRNRRKLANWIGRDDVEIVWGDLMDADAVRRAMGQADVVLHMGGMVSPEADYYPARTLNVNVRGTRNVVDAVCRLQQTKDVGLIYIGSVAEMSHHDAPCHWGRCGDPLLAGDGDAYGLSKILAEREVVFGGVRRWAVLRQTGILHGGLFTKVDNPTMYHVPLRGVLEWATVEDSGRLMERVCRRDVPEEFWRGFYNISSGAEYRLTNYEFERMILKATHCPPPEKVFDARWFALRNFHGMWYTDADRLEKLVPFRKNVSARDYFKELARHTPWWMALSVLAPAALVKSVMKRVALKPVYGTLHWLRADDEESEANLKRFYGGREAMEAIKGWKNVDLSRPDMTPRKLDHGYDESKPDATLGLEDMEMAARWRGGKCLSESMTRGDIDTPLEWECARGHRFSMSPRAVLKGGHWCGGCLPEADADGTMKFRYDEEARLNPFMAQVWYAAHGPEENL